MRLQPRESLNVFGWSELSVDIQGAQLKKGLVLKIGLGASWPLRLGLGPLQPLKQTEPTQWKSIFNVIMRIHFLSHNPHPPTRPSTPLFLKVTGLWNAKTHSIEYASSVIHYLVKLGFFGTDQAQRLKAALPSPRIAACSFSLGLMWPSSDVLQFYWLWCVSVGQLSALQLPARFESIRLPHLPFCFSIPNDMS